MGNDLIGQAARDTSLTEETRLRAQGLKAENEKLWDDAITIWRKALKKEPDEAELHFRLAYALHASSEKQDDKDRKTDLLSQAAEHYQRASELAPDKTSILNNLGTTLDAWAKLTGDQTMFQQACDKFKCATDIDQKDAVAFYNWGNTLGDWATLTGDQTKFQQACDAFKRATDIDQNYAVAFNNWGNTLVAWARLAGDQTKFQQACDKFERATDIDQNHAAAFSNWGLALVEWAKLSGDPTKFQQACDKFKRATDLDQSLAAAFNNWGSTLLSWADATQEPRSSELLAQARGPLLRAEDIKPGTGAYNLACLAARTGDEEGCRKWLAVCQEHGTMPDCQHLQQDDDLAPMRDKDWFKTLLAQVCPEEAPPGAGAERQGNA
jgi:tetratricopeptide (TPR) repeat protein